MISVQTNKTLIDINFKNLFEDFEILSTPFNGEKQNEFINKIKKLKNEIKPAAYIIYKNQFIYLLEKSNIQKIEENSKKVPKYIFKEIEYNYIANLIFQIIISKKNYFEIIDEPSKIFYFLRAKKGIISTVSIEIDKDNLMQINAVAFKKIASIEEAKGKSIFILNGKLINSYDKNIHDKKQLYIKENYKNKKEVVSFFSRRKEDYVYTKSYVAGLFLNDVDKYLSNYISINFYKKEMNKYCNYNNTYKKKKILKIENIFNERIKTLNILNFTKFATDEIVEKVKMNNKHNILITIDEKLENSEYNMIILHSKEHYVKNKISDPYLKLKNKYPYCQIITVDEKLNSFSDHVMTMILKELLIKNDIKNEIITLNSNIFSLKKIYTVEKIKTNDIINYRIDKLEINKNGNIAFEELSKNDEYEFILEIYIKNIKERSEIEAIVIDFIGNVNLISRTNEAPIVDFRSIFEYYIEGDESGAWNPSRKKNNDNKNQKKNFHMVEGFHHLKYYTFEDKGYYTAGVYEGTNAFSKRSPIREITPCKGDLFLDNILKSLDEFFVKNNDFTVVPYFLKYINEAKKIRNYINSWEC